MKAVGYCRYSSENQRDGYSIQAQTSAIKKYCEDNNITLLNLYVDEARSGTSDDRESFQRLIKDAASRSFELLIVHKSDRLFRNRYDSAIYKKKLKDYGVKVVSILEPMLDGSPESIMIESMLEGMAEYYSANLARETKKGIIESAKLCHYIGSRYRPFGYNIVNKSYVVNEEEAPGIRLIFDLYVNGYNQFEIATKVSEKGYITTGGHAFTHGTIRSILRNKIYGGIYVYGTEGKTKEYFEVPGGVPAIVDPSTFAKAWEIMDGFVEKRAKARQRFNDNRFILTGFLRCPEGRRLCGNSKRLDKDGYVKKSSYRCIRYTLHDKPAPCHSCAIGQWISQSVLEDTTIGIIEKGLLSAKSISSVVDMLDKSINKKETSSKADIEKLKKSIERVKSRQAKLLDVYLDGSLDKETYKSKSHDLSVELARLNDELGLLLVPAVKPIDKAKILQALKVVVSSKEKSEAYKVKLINTFLDHIVVHQDKLEFFFKFPFVDGSFDLSGASSQNKDICDLVYNRTNAKAYYILYTSITRDRILGVPKDYLKQVSLSLI